MSIESFRGPGGAQWRNRYDDFTDPWKDTPTVVLAHNEPEGELGPRDIVIDK